MTTFLKAVARKGAAGNTACWAARLYHRWVRLTPEDPVALDVVLTALIAARYDVDALLRPGGCSQKIRGALGTLLDAGEIRSICHAVVLILTAEADFADHHDDAKAAIVEVIVAELAAAGIPGEHAFAQDRHLCAEGLCAVYLPSMRLLRLLLQV